jgi:NhaP-type Na+/H+ or K+/H+ antiporter
MLMKKRYMNPYLAGTMLGLVLLLAMYLSGRGLGASGGMKYCVVSIVGAVDRNHADNSAYYSKYFENGGKPLKNWLTFEILGVVIGGFISGAISGRLKLKVERSPSISVKRRLIFSFLGGVFFVYGAQLARGCTSGAALSGMAVLSVAGFVTMMAIFGSAYLFAWFFRKNWI